MFDVNSLTVFNLSKGAHADPEKGVCAMEAVAWLEGLEHTDKPACTCDVVAAFVRPLNDWLNDAERQRLVAYLPRLVGTVSPDHRKARAEVAAWKALHAFASMALEVAGFGAHAAKLRASKTLQEGENIARAAYAYAAYAAYAKRAELVNAAFACLDEMLAIGPAGTFSRDVGPAVQAYRELVAV